MNKYIKYILAVLAAAGVLVVLLIVVVSLVINPNDYKPHIVQMVKEQKQRKLTLAGDIKLTFFPMLGLDLGRASVSEFRGEKEFASVESAHLYLSWWPLLRNQLVVDQVRIEGIRANLVLFKDDTTNFDDLLKKDAEDDQIKFDIDSVLIDNSALSFRDETEGRQFVLSDIKIKTGRLANGKPTKAAADFNLKGDNPLVNVRIHLNSALTFDTAAGRYAIKDMNLEIQGEAIGGEIGIVASVPSLASDRQSLKADTLNIELSAKQPGGKYKGELSLSLIGNFKDKLFLLTPLKGNLTAGNTIMSGGGMNLDIAGSAQLDLRHKQATVDLTLHLDESNINLKAGASPFSDPHIALDLNIDRLDADRYLPTQTPENPAQPGKPFDFSILKILNANGSVRVGGLKLYNIKAGNVAIEFKAGGGKLSVSPLTAELYQGSASGAMSLDAADQRITARQNILGVNIAPLLKDALNQNILEGRGNINFDLSAKGDSVGAMKKTLQGKAGLSLRDGAVNGINIPARLREAQAGLSVLKGEKIQTANMQEKTDFSELSASFNINRGVAHNKDLSAKSPLLRVSGNGDIDIGAEMLNYRIRATVVSSLEGQGGRELSALKGVTVPVRVTGPFAAPEFAFDFNALIAESVKNEIKTRAADVLKEGFKGLFH